MLTIKQKFILAGTLSFLSMIGLLFLSQYTTQKLKKFNTVSLEIAHIEADMLLLRRNEKDFLARNNLKYTEKFEKNFALLVNQPLKRLSSAVQDVNLDTAAVNSMKASFHQYKKSFTELVAIQKKIGLNPKDGLYGLLRDAIHQVEEQIKTVNNQHLRADMLKLRRNEKDFMLRLDLNYQKKFEHNITVFIKTLNNSDLPDTTKEQLLSGIKLYQTRFTTFVNHTKIKGLTAKDGLLGVMRSSVHNSEGILSKLSQDLNTVIEHEVGNLDRFVMTTSSIGLILALSVVIVMIWLARGILTPMKSLARTMAKATTENDLSLRVKINSKDEIGQTGQAFNTMLERFQTIIFEINKSAQQINKTSDELSSITRETNEGSQAQQQQTSLVVSAMAQMRNCVQEVAQNAAEAAVFTTETKEKSSQGADIVKSAAKTINVLSTDILKAADAIKKVEDDSEQIGSVLAVIRGIAEQTNLLALNAAIEAARAGEQGRGFAVVADEVRTLAGRTQEATQEIQQMIETLQSGSKNAVILMETSQSQTNNGVQQTSAAGEAISGIVNSVENIDDMNTMIATSAERQSTVAKDINVNIEAINDISLSLSQKADQTAYASDNLAQLAVALNELIIKFKV